MIEATRSPVDGLWRAWALFERSRLGEISEAEIAAGAPDLPRWVIVAVAKTKGAAIRNGLRVAQHITPKEAA